MPQAHIPANVGPITLEYETMGKATDPAVLLIMGFGAQLINWSDQFCQMLVDQDFCVIRFDNRDCGLSTKLDGVVVDPDVVLTAVLNGQDLPQVPYTLSDMAQDAIELLDHLGIESAHILGASMGGMIAQTLVIQHPERARSLISLYSVTGEFEIGAPTAEAAEALLGPPPTDRQAYIDASPKYGVWQSKRYFNEAVVKREAARAYDRSFYPEGSIRQLAAIYASGSRAEQLQKLQTPTLVIHGEDDTLLTPDGGKRTAELVPGSTFLLVADMGHDLPEPLLPLVTGAMTAHMKLAEWQRATGH
ncbi:MAG: alpha/beta fold hydrolase [Actinomycetota bacterium]|nr:alpha/beta fold hydrolase [Actinomycetota bacterium]MDA3019434.1 alpha/beta fold hydrolase [Actinomycetota bacterium]